MRLEAILKFIYFFSAQSEGFMTFIDIDHDSHLGFLTDKVNHKW